MSCNEGEFATHLEFEQLSNSVRHTGQLNATDSTRRFSRGYNCEHMRFYQLANKTRLFNRNLESAVLFVAVKCLHHTHPTLGTLRWWQQWDCCHKNPLRMLQNTGLHNTYYVLLCTVLHTVNLDCFDSVVVSNYINDPKPFHQSVYVI